LFVVDCDDPVVRISTDEVRPAQAMAKQVDGLLLLSPTMSDDDLRALSEEVPLAVINRGLDGIPAVLMPVADGAVAAVEHLQALGHRRLAYLGGPDNYSNRARVNAFTRTCRRLGVDSVVMGPFDPTFAGGVRAADLVLAAGQTGVLAYNDDIAAGVVGRRADRDVPVPGRLSIVGFDDSVLASMVNPRLTTVRLAMSDTGVVAVRLLLALVRGAPPGSGPVDLPAELAHRAAQLIGVGNAVAFDSGPSAYELARALPDGFAGSVITHSCRSCSCLPSGQRRSGLRLVALGGELTGARQALVGPTTLDAIADLRVRTFFLDAAAVDARGTYACSTAEARVPRGLAEIADEVVLRAAAAVFTGSAPPW
jgi:hypothetical protein